MWKVVGYPCALALAFILAGDCASSSYGTKIDTKKVARIEKGVTTRAEVERMFGPPMNTAMMGDGRRMMMYTYSATKSKANASAFVPVVNMFASSADATTHTQQLQIILSKLDVVEDYELTDGANKMTTTMGIANMSMHSKPTAVPASSR